MRLDTKALTLAIGLLWGGALLLTALFNLWTGGYGGALLDLMASLYPGYDGPDGFGSVIVVTLYGVLDGALAGFFTAWLYNLARARGASPAAPS